MLEHVNNAVYFAPVEQALAGRRALRAPMTVVVEHGDAMHLRRQLGFVLLRDVRVISEHPHAEAGRRVRHLDADGAEAGLRRSVALILSLDPSAAITSGDLVTLRANPRI